MSRLLGTASDWRPFEHFRTFITARDFTDPDLTVMPGRVLSEQEQLDQEMREQLEYEDAIRIGDDFSHDF